MLDFNSYLARHGECWVQALIEQEERIKGISASVEIPLEVRWNTVMNDQPTQQSFFAA